MFVLCLFGIHTRSERDPARILWGFYVDLLGEDGSERRLCIISLWNSLAHRNKCRTFAV